jgi:hypothetical protein
MFLPKVPASGIVQTGSSILRSQTRRGLIRTFASGELYQTQTATTRGISSSPFTQYRQTANMAASITHWVSSNDKTGEFKRQVSSFRDAISREPGAQYPPEKGRYHLYVSYACPWVGIPSFSQSLLCHWAHTPRKQSQLTLSTYRLTEPSLPASLRVLRISSPSPSSTGISAKAAGAS